MMTDAENPRTPQVSQAPAMSPVKSSEPYASRSAPQYSSRAPDTVDPQTASNRFAVIVLGILVVIGLGVAAIVLPFTLDTYCNCPDIPNVLASPEPSESPNSTPSPTVPPGTPTESPTRLGDESDRFKQFVDNFARGISGDEPFQDPDSPQYRAALFIADEVTFDDGLSSLGQVEDLYAVTVFYYSTNGDDWTECSQGSTDCQGESWLNPDLTNCDWNWISCNDEGRVVDIIFSRYSLEYLANNARTFLNLRVSSLIFLKQMPTEIISMDPLLWRWAY